VQYKSNEDIPKKIKYLSDYKSNAYNWITLATGEYYPDILPYACELYKPVLVLFGQLLKTSESPERLFLQISEITPIWMRIQLLRVFRKYVSPAISVEMTKRKSSIKEIIATFGAQFRPIHEVQAAYDTRPVPDEALCAILWEYKDRGKKGYDLTERFFEMVRSRFKDFTIEGPERAGKDILMGTIFPDYPNPTRPVDFVIYGARKNDVLAIGLARYDSDRGGAQEDDRTGQYHSAIDEILGYARTHNLGTKVILLNDGPGLLLGSMWNDYIKLEESHPDKVMVLTLRMVPERLTVDWLQPMQDK
jgi:hypothetical protein